MPFCLSAHCSDTYSVRCSLGSTVRFLVKVLVPDEDNILTLINELFTAQIALVSQTVFRLIPTKKGTPCGGAFVKSASTTHRNRGRTRTGADAIGSRRFPCAWR